jgi:hypothetical protein
MAGVEAMLAKIVAGFLAMVSSWLCFGFLLGFWWGERGTK